MALEKLKKAAIVGSGSMGHGIAEMLAMNGVEVTMIDINDELLQQAKNKVKWSLDKTK